MSQSLPPDTCQRCREVVHTISPSDVHRWTCGRMLHMHPTCTRFTPLPDGRRADPATHHEGDCHE